MDCIKPWNYVSSGLEKMELNMMKSMRNELLRELPEAELSLLDGKLQPVFLTVGEDLYEPFRRIDYLYFPEDSLISLISVTRDGDTIEIGVVGREGLFGAAAIFGGETIPYKATVQGSGRAYRIDLLTLRTITAKAALLQMRLFSYLHSIHMQIVQSSICNKFHTVQERMARWLLMSVDRTGEYTLGYTHEFLAMMLGTQRTTVTRTLSSLQALGLIRNGRATLTVTHRTGLEALSCECYTIINREMNKLRATVL
jgi:CRP-like cAMP-binding protein